MLRNLIRWVNGENDNVVEDGVMPSFSDIADAYRWECENPLYWVPTEEESIIADRPRHFDSLPMMPIVVAGCVSNGC